MGFDTYPKKLAFESVSFEPAIDYIYYPILKTPLMDV
jgi:hypothetical protein